MKRFSGVTESLTDREFDLSATRLDHFAAAATFSTDGSMPDEVWCHRRKRLMDCGELKDPNACAKFVEVTQMTPAAPRSVDATTRNAILESRA
jgi:hypothetical protein